MRPTWIVLAAVVLTPVCAGAEGQGTASPPHVNFCFAPDEVAAWRRPASESLMVRMRDGRVYRLQLDAGCGAVQGGRLLLQGPSAGLICSVQGLTASTQGAGSGSCAVRTLHLLSAPEVAALPDGDRP